MELLVGDLLEARGEEGAQVIFGGEGLRLQGGEVLLRWVVRSTGEGRKGV